MCCVVVVYINDYNIDISQIYMFVIYIYIYIYVCISQRRQAAVRRYNTLCDASTSQIYDCMRNITNISIYCRYIALSIMFHVCNVISLYIPPSSRVWWSIYTTVSPLPSFPTLGDAFKIVKEPCDECSAVVVETPADQDGVSVYIALDSESYGHTNRPGNGGIRLLNYKSYVRCFFC